MTHVSLITPQLYTNGTLGRKKNYISVFEAKIVTPRIKRIYILVYYLQEKFDNGLFVPRYDKYSFMPEYMCNKPCSGPIISRSTKWVTGFIFYPTSDTEHY